MKKVALATLTCVAALSGCASIVGGTSQVVSVQTVKGGDELAGASCKLENDKGVWFIKTPGSVTVHRAYGELSVKCEKNGVDPGIATVKSSTKGMAFGNILFGGLIGAGVDMSTGAAYDYPALITVSMGSTTVIDAPIKPDAVPPAPAAAKQQPGPTLAAAKAAQSSTDTAK
jgi:hypothetical protein